jgi:hypothetical protein
VHNNVKAPFINPIASYPFIARKWLEHWELGFHTGDLMFIFTGQDTVQSSKSSILANLPTLNHILRKGQLGEVHYRQFSEPRDWAFIGVMRNSSAASGLRPRQQGTKRGGNSIAPERIINIDVRGATRMFNYWESARAGSHLWLVWRALELEGEIESLASSRRAVKEGAPNVSCWQLLPQDGNARTQYEDGTVGGMDYQPLRVWWNEQVVRSRTCRRPVCVGWVFQSIGAGEVSDSAVAVRKATLVAEDRFKLPMVNVFLHV